MRTPLTLAVLISVTLVVCTRSRNHAHRSDADKTCECPSDTLRNTAYAGVKGALLATRFESLEEFKSIVQIEYFNSPSGNTFSVKSMVRLRYCSNGEELISVLKSGISQDDLMAAKDDDIWSQIGLAIRVPYAVSIRIELKRIYALARRNKIFFGAGDVAFYDFAEIAANKINPTPLAYLSVGDSSEKGYINTFNHITAQAFITSLYSEEVADFIADVHELKNMPELTSGKFTEDQLTHPLNNPVENYVDMINNEWGQKLGRYLKRKYHIDQNVRWTPELLADYVNDIQHYYSWAFRIEMEPFRPEEEVIWRFARKINIVMDGGLDNS